MMNLGIFARTFPANNIDEVCRAAARSGFRHVHWNMVCAGLPALPQSIPVSTIRKIQQALNRHQLTLCGISATYNMCHPDPEVRQDGLDKLEIIAQNCAALQTDLITLCTGSRNPSNKWGFHPDNNSPQSWQNLLENMDKALRIAERCDIRLGIEPELGNIVNSIGKANRLLNTFQSPRLKIVLDAANLFESASSSEIKQLIDEAIRVLGPHIFIAHAKDRNSEGQFVPPGQGLVPFAYLEDQLLSKTNCRMMVAHGFKAVDAASVFQFLSR